MLLRLHLLLLLLLLRRHLRLLLLLSVVLRLHLLDQQQLEYKGWENLRQNVHKE